jgi:hypothetical protein
MPSPPARKSNPIDAQNNEVAGPTPVISTSRAIPKHRTPQSVKAAPPIFVVRSGDRAGPKRWINREGHDRTAFFTGILLLEKGPCISVFILSLGTGTGPFLPPSHFLPAEHEHPGSGSTYCFYPICRRKSFRHLMSPSSSTPFGETRCSEASTKKVQVTRTLLAGKVRRWPGDARTLAPAKEFALS